MFIYGEFTKPPSSSQGTIEDYGTATFDTSNNQPIEIRVSSSFISLDQAKKNFQLELMNNSSNLTFDQVKNEATSK
jgi:putative alpha-1,2-mannosidase